MFSPTFSQRFHTHASGRFFSKLPDISADALQLKRSAQDEVYVCHAEHKVAYLVIGHACVYVGEWFPLRFGFSLVLSLV